MTTSNGRILVVDDDEMNRDMLSRRLLRKGYEVETARDGAEALALIAARSFDLILLDVMMPGIDGVEVLRTIRRERTISELPVIMATARDQSENVVAALEAGANDYVTKPIDFPVVLARVQTQLALKRAMDEIRRLERNVEEQNEILETTNRKLATVNNRMRRDLDAAAKIQRAFLPRSLPETRAARFSWRYLPCDELAGDGLNIFMLDHDHIGFYVLDVSGHGVASALLSVTIAKLLNPDVAVSDLLVELDPATGAERINPPSDVVARLNRNYPWDPETEQYFTIQYGVLDTRSGELRIASAGHPSPVLARAEVAAAIVDIPGLPVGLDEDAEFVETSIPLRPGDRVVLYSDGVHETMDDDGRIFGQTRLIETLERKRSSPLDDQIRDLLDEITRFSASAGFHDDVSILALEYLGAIA